MRLRVVLLWVGLALVAVALGSWGYGAYQNTVNLKGANDALDRVGTGAPEPATSWRNPAIFAAGALCILVSLLPIGSPVNREDEA